MLCVVGWKGRGAGGLQGSHCSLFTEIYHQLHPCGVVYLFGAHCNIFLWVPERLNVRLCEVEEEPVA